MHRFLGVVVLAAGPAFFPVVSSARAQGPAHGPRGAVAHQPTLIETFHEDFEASAVGGLVADLPGWGATPVAVMTDLSSQFSGFGSRSGFVDDLSVFSSHGAFAIVSTPLSGVEHIGVASIDVVAEGIRAGDSIRISLVDQSRGIIINSVFLEGDGDIAFLEALEGGGETLTDSGFDWTGGEPVSLEFELTLTGQAILRADGELIALAPNFATFGDFISFTHIQIQFAALDPEGAPTGSLGFDNVSYQHAQLPDTGCAGDLDGDGQVGSSDLAILLGGWGPCS